MIQDDDKIGMSAAAKLRKVTRQYLARLVTAGEVPGVSLVAGRYLFSRAVYEPWAKEQVAIKKKREKYRNRINP
jgi:hypothetical protein